MMTPWVAPGHHSAPQTRTLLSLTDVHTDIGGSQILQGVSFDVTAGEVTVLLGRNGAGKSTTLRTIIGVLVARRGSIRLDGQELRGKPAHWVARQGLGFVPEDREVFATLSVEENLKLALRQQGQEAKNAIEYVYTLFPDLYDARHRSAGTLSGGQQQMLAIGRALVNRNRVILVDEPTKGLAPIIIDRLQDIIRKLRGQTILLVEQNLTFAQAVGDRFFLLNDGRIVRGGSIHELVMEPEILRHHLGV
jgi:branched-chain amino acid transport system ATP-binding protein